MRVSAAGGAPVPVTSLAPETDQNHRFPHFLPDGDHFLYYRYPLTDAKGELRLDSLSRPGARTVLTEATNAQYAEGTLYFVRGGVLVAQRFDVERATLTGEPRSVRNAVEDQGIGFYAFSISRTGAIASRQPTQNMPMRQLTWFNTRGVALAKLGGPARLTELALSPDGRRVLFTRLDGDINVWTLDVERGAEQRLTPGAASHYKGVWSPTDGARVAFGTLTGSAFTLSSVASDGGGSPQVLMNSNFRMEPAGWTPDGKWFYYHFFDQPNPWSLWRIGPGSTAPATLFRRDAGAAIGHATISADGRWIVYDSTASGRSEVFVESLETPGRRWQVSPAGGAVPRWRFDQREL